MTAFKYQHILEAMAERAKVSETPWDVVQANNGDRWQSLTGMRIFKDQIEYRLKPETKAIDWSQIAPNVPVKVWDSGDELMETGFLSAYYAASNLPFNMTGGDFEHASLETDKWVFNYGGANPWPEGVEVEVILRRTHKRYSKIDEASRFRWDVDCDPEDIIASRCVGLAKGWTYEEGE
jgi:hypothetical protein